MTKLWDDPDAAMKDKVMNGEVAFDGASPFELLYHFFPNGSWFAQVTSKFFIGEIPGCVVDFTPT